MKNSNDFSSSIEKLHSTANSINSGLAGIVGAIDNMAKNNLDLIEPTAKKPTDDDDFSIQNLLQSIRHQINEVVSHGQKFEGLIETYAAGIESLSQQLKQSRQASLLDSVTGIANRKSLSTSLQAILEDVSKYNNKVSLLMADIDNFKAVNDELGQSIGDQVLRLVASNFAFNLGENDLLGRWDGDEFVAILPGIGLDQAVGTAEKVRKSISSRSLRKQKTGETMGKVSLSMGVSTYSKGDKDEDLLHRADVALRKAKETGRNRIVREKD